MKKILIIEDEVDLALTISARLKLRGYDAAVAEDGVSALDIMKQDKIDLIILDLGLPNMDGETFLLIIKSRDDFKDLPVIVLTVNSDVAMEERCSSIGVDAYLIKPYNPETLLAKVKELLKT